MVTSWSVESPNIKWSGFKPCPGTLCCVLGQDTETIDKNQSDGATRLWPHIQVANYIRGTLTEGLMHLTD